MMKSGAILSFATAILLTLPVWSMRPASQFYEGTWQFQATPKYWASTANYTGSGGEYESLPFSNEFNITTLNTSARSVFVDNWGIYLDLESGMSNSKDQLNSRSNSNLSNITVGTDFLLINWESYRLALDIAYKSAIFKVDRTSDDVSIGEGLNEASVDFQNHFQLRQFNPYLTLGYVHRDDGASTLFKYRLGFEIVYTKNVVGGEIAGYTSASDDTYTSTPSRREFYKSRNGLSNHFHSVNPAYHEAMGWFGFNVLESSKIRVGAGSSFTGTNSGAGYFVFANFELAFLPEKAKTRSKPTDKKATSRGATKNGKGDVEEFQEETNDGIDQNIFYQPTITD